MNHLKDFEFVYLLTEKQNLRFLERLKDHPFHPFQLCKCEFEKMDFPGKGNYNYVQVFLTCVSFTQLCRSIK